MAYILVQSASIQQLSPLAFAMDGGRQRGGQPEA